MLEADRRCWRAVLVRWVPEEPLLAPRLPQAVLAQAVLVQFPVEEVQLSLPVLLLSLPVLLPLVRAVLAPEWLQEWPELPLALRQLVSVVPLSVLAELR